MCILDERISACTSPGDGHTGNPPRRIFYFIFSLLSDYVDSSREENIISVAKRAHASSEKKKRTHRGQRNELNKKRKKRKKKRTDEQFFFFFVNFLLISSFSAFVNPRERKKKKNEIFILLCARHQQTHPTNCWCFQLFFFPVCVLFSFLSLDGLYVLIFPSRLVLSVVSSKLNCNCSQFFLFFVYVCPLFLPERKRKEKKCLFPVKSTNKSSRTTTTSTIVYLYIPLFNVSPRCVIK